MSEPIAQPWSLKADYSKLITQSSLLKAHCSKLIANTQEPNRKVIRVQILSALHSPFSGLAGAVSSDGESDFGVEEEAARFLAPSSASAAKRSRYFSVAI